MKITPVNYNSKFNQNKQESFGIKLLVDNPNEVLGRIVVEKTEVERTYEKICVKQSLSKVLEEINAKDIDRIFQCVFHELRVPIWKLRKLISNYKKEELKLDIIPEVNLDPVSNMVTNNLVFRIEDSNHITGESLTDTQRPNFTGEYTGFNQVMLTRDDRDHGGKEPVIKTAICEALKDYARNLLVREKITQ